MRGGGQEGGSLKWRHSTEGRQENCMEAPEGAVGVECGKRNPIPESISGSQREVEEEKRSRWVFYV